MKELRRNLGEGFYREVQKEKVVLHPGKTPLLSVLSVIIHGSTKDPANVFYPPNTVSDGKILVDDAIYFHTGNSLFI
jgi:hypothetical protein